MRDAQSEEVRSLDVGSPLPAACGGVVFPHRLRRRGATFGLRPQYSGLRPDLILDRPSPPPAAALSLHTASGGVGRLSAFGLNIRPSAGPDIGSPLPAACGGVVAQRRLWRRFATFGLRSQSSGLWPDVVYFSRCITLEHLQNGIPVFRISLNAENHSVLIASFLSSERVPVLRLKPKHIKRQRCTPSCRRTGQLFLIKVALFP